MASARKRSLTPLFVLLVFALAVVLYTNLKREMAVLDRELASTVSAFESMVDAGILEKTVGLTDLQVSKRFSQTVYEYLYPRSHTIDKLRREITELLTQHGIEVRNVTADESTPDLTFELGSQAVTSAKLILSPDMSTIAGRICLIIDDFGYNLNSVVGEFLTLEVPATFAVLPGHAYTKQVAAHADEAGFEIIVHMPMESKDRRPGEDEFVLERGMTRKEISARVNDALSEIPQARGINNHQGSDATENRRVMRFVAEVLKFQGKYFVDSRTSSGSVAEAQMRRADVPVAARNVFIDYEDNQEIVRKQLLLLAGHAREYGSAVGIGHPRKNTLAALKEVIPRLEREGFEFVFASDVVQ